jgi:hypothetical protein
MTTRQTIREFVDTLVRQPNVAFIQEGGRTAILFDTERASILMLRGNFLGLREEVNWELRQAIAEQHPLPKTEGTLL